MEHISIIPNYYHAKLVNNPPYITNHPVYEKLKETKQEFFDDEYYALKNFKNDTKLIKSCVLIFFLTIVSGCFYFWKKAKLSLNKLKSLFKK